MKKTVTALCVLLLVVSQAVAQNTAPANNGAQAEIEFDEMSYDFGTVKEESNSVTHEFFFTNTGKADLILSSVRASCGCTTPKWDREPVKPGERGSILVRYSTSGRPGAFTKTITVKSNAPMEKRLTIKGTVTPKGQKIESAYPVVKGSIRVKNENINFGDVNNTETVTVKYPVANATNKEQTVTFVNLPSYISVAPKRLTANEWTNLDVTFDGAKAKDWGAKRTDISFVTTENKTPQMLHTTANIKEKFTKEDEANAPIIVVTEKMDAGDVAVNGTKKFVLTISNRGQRPLYLRKISSGSDDLVVKTPTKGIAPGKSLAVKVKINAKGQATNAKVSRVLSVINNDPVHPVKNVKVEYRVN